MAYQDVKKEMTSRRKTKPHRFSKPVRFLCRQLNGNYPTYFFSTTEAFVPPKPKEFDIAALTVMFRALLGT
ncbi:hypothetical protein U14_01550 [Candidatus Moduliflexus flocculans]|uniref:Uncharacterized protein n=1 Tax=Candidatus Moduliflexus flocculans TaxID=1499966 RepID=A0A0S6VSJ9_9BACT|nr:hypothetical protein U14_01550 [Candidatus Moduliflexus flocculans]